MKEEQVAQSSGMISKGQGHEVLRAYVLDRILMGPSVWCMPESGIVRFEWLDWTLHVVAILSSV